jgi:hypothetical protein
MKLLHRVIQKIEASPTSSLEIALLPFALSHLDRIHQSLRLGHLIDRSQEFFNLNRLIHHDAS